MYEVMARRYRPATFDEVVGQEHIAATLKNAITRDRVAHAFIFTGGHGCGKTTMARILAKALVCEKGPTPDPCGVCSICRDVAAGRDTDVLEIDGASNNGIEQIRQLREQAAYVPTRSRYKIYIIDEVHMLSDGAFNALLKTLEEPPRHVKFILATTDPHKVPDTILSRCQRFDFRLVPQIKLAAFFRRLAGEEKAAISDDALDAVAAFAEGSVRDGLVLLDQLLSFADGEVTRKDVEAVRGVASAENVAGIFACIASSDVTRALAIVDEVASRGTNVGDFLDQLVSFGRDLMIFAATGSPEGVSAYGPARETLLNIGKTASLESALLYLDVLAQARTRVRTRALTNPLVVLEMAVARLAGLGGVTSVSEILSRLDGLPAAPPPRRRAEPEAAPPLPPPAAPVVSVEKNREEPVRPIAAVPPAKVEADTETGEPEKVEEKNTREGRTEDVVVPTESVVDQTADFPPLTMEQVEPLWEKVLDRLAEKHPADLRHMARIALEGVADDGTVMLAGPPTVIEAWEDRHRLARLGDAAAAILGQPARFAFTARQVRRNAGATGADDEAKFKLARHPAVDRIKSLFDGVIVNCQTAESTPEEPGMNEDGQPGQDSPHYDETYE